MTFFLLLYHEFRAAEPEKSRLSRIYFYLSSNSVLMFALFLLSHVRGNFFHVYLPKVLRFYKTIYPYHFFLCNEMIFIIWKQSLRYVVDSSSPHEYKI